MSDLLSLLHQGANALGVYRSMSATATHNIQNADTPGFSRQRATLAATTAADRIAGAFIGRGVLLQGITQARDRFVERQIPLALSQSSASSAESSALQSLTALNPNGPLPGALGTFYSSMRALAQNPSDAGLRQAFVGQSSTLAMAFNRSASEITEARKGLDSQLTGTVAEINGLAEQMASLNRQISMARASGAPPNDLMDARQNIQDQLVSLTGATPIENSDATINLQLPQGPVLVSGDLAARLGTLPDPSNNGHLQLQYSSPDGAPAVALEAKGGGQLGGILSARDGAFKTALHDLDKLAYELSDKLNTQHRAGYGLDGSSGRDFFNVGTTVDGAATRMALNPDLSSDTSRLATAGSLATLPGDASNIQLMVATEQQALTSGTSPVDALTNIITSFGVSAQKIQALASHDEAILNHVQGLRESASGVSIDEEMINLTRAQRAYEAVTKVIQTTNEMLDTLMQLK